MQHNSNSTSLASEIVVFNDSRPPNRLPKKTSGSCRPFILYFKIKAAFFIPTRQCFIFTLGRKLSGIKSEVNNFLSLLPRVSLSLVDLPHSRSMPDGRFFFSDWSQEREINPFNPSLKELVIFFFCYLFETFKLSVSSIKGYRSAISNTL